MPFLILLAARGLTLLIDRVASWSGFFGRKLGLVDEPIAITRALGYGLLVVLLGVSVHGWVLGKHFDTAWNDHTPRTISELKGFNGADDRLLKKAAELDLHNALVLVKTCPNWQCYGTVFWKNSTDFNGDIVWARDVPDMHNPDILALYSGRQIYFADYGAGTIVPYELPLGLSNATTGR
jgi:hypothetical protein